jgi:TolB-like protein
MNATNALRIALAAGVLALAAPVSAGDPYNGLARELRAAAEQGSLRRIAVLPFSPAGRPDAEGGLILAERLVSRLAGSGSLEVVERTHLDKVLEEQRLGSSGALDPRQAREMGRLLGVDAIVTGTFTAMADRRVEVHARLIDAQTARILGAATARVEKEWEEDQMPVGALWDVRSPSIPKFPAPLVRLVPDPFRDAPNDSCSGWEEELDKLQEDTLELKARFWAARLADPGFDARSITRNPGSDIRSMGRRQAFFARVKELYREGPEPLERFERDSLEAADRRAADLTERCY